MTPHRLDPVLRHVRGVGGPPADDQPDAALLVDFARTGDEGAFAVLVRRHGPMVLGVCRRLLADTHAAEDAFQATFLLLAKKARWLRHPDRLGPWLYGVAKRVALKARSTASRRREVAAVDVPAPSVDDVNDLRPIIDAAIARLPDRYREPVVLCYLQGLTNVEAATRLRCPLGTVATRLSRARDRLRVLLTRQGVVPAAGALAAALTPEATSAVVSDNLLRSTARWAAAYAAGSIAIIPTNILTLSREVAQTMILDKLKMVAVLAILGATGAGVALSRQTGGEPSAKRDVPPDVVTNKPTRGAERALPLTLLRQKPPDAYLLEAGDLLGVFVEDVFGAKGSVPPIINITPDQSAGHNPLPAVGYPVPVQQNGTIALPYLDALPVRGKSIDEVRKSVSDAYQQRGVLRPDQPVMVSLAKPRTYRITVVRQETGARRPTIHSLELPAYENDVLNALARAGGLPFGDALVIQRGGAAIGATAGAVTAGVRQVRIPLRIRPDEPLPFKPDDVILKTGDILMVDGGDEPAPPRAAESDKPAWPAAALTLAVAAPDGRILVQLPGGSWKLFDAAKLSATDTDGKPVAAVAERLKAMTAVLVAADGKPPAAQYLQLVKPGTLVLVLPKEQ
jgi:RNA polymerase sigma factor (sigma-70 family)